MREGISPTPTGTTHNLTLTRDQFDVARDLLARRDQHFRWRNQSEVDSLEEELRRQPWWPRDFQPGDHFVLREAAKIISTPTRSATRAFQRAWLV